MFVDVEGAGRIFPRTSHFIRFTIGIVACWKLKFSIGCGDYCGQKIWHSFYVELEETGNVDFESGYMSDLE